MNNLADLQENFQNYLLSGQSDIEQFIVSTKSVSAFKRLSIYKEAYQARLIECLGSNFPCLKIHVGDEKFAELGIAYMNEHPSTYRSVRWFGDKFADFLNQYEGNQFPYLSELAQFEWKMTLTFDAPDHPALPIEQMASVPGDAWSRMILIPHPSLQRLNFHWNVVSLWQSIANEKLLEPLVENSTTESWVLWRIDYINRFYLLSANEAWAMDAMISGATFGEMCEGLCQWFPEEEVGLRAASLLKGWIQSGLLADFRFSD